MASGSDKPQLPRGLIGRTGTPSGKGTRLPSIRGPRDLTLGGVPKKVFTPNIPARREKKEGQNETPGPSTSGEKKPKMSSDSGRGGQRGRGRGRGRGRDQNIIQSHSIFEQGPTEKTIKSSSSYDPIDRGGGGGGGGGGSGGSRISVKKEKDTMTKEVLDNLLKDDFIEFKPEDQDVTLLPVKLPLQIKTEVDVKSDLDPKFTQVKVKSEPMDTDEVVKPKTAVEDEKPKVFNNKQATRPVTCTDLFSNPAKSDTDQLLFFQLPDSLPGLPPSSEDDFRDRKNKDKKEKTTTEEESLEKKMSGCNLEDFSEGLIGKLIVRKSGRVQMMLGQTLLDVEMGTPCGFLQDLVSVEVNGDHGDLSVLGHVDHRLVCTPDFEALLDNS